MSFWYCAKPLQSPFTLRQTPAKLGQSRQGPSGATLTICNFQVKRQRPDPYRAMVAEASDYIRANVKGLILGQNLFTNRLPHADADLTNGALFLDSVVGLRPTTWIGKAAKYEYPRLQVVGASHDEHHYEIASQLVNDVFTLLAETFNREVG